MTDTGHPDSEPDAAVPDNPTAATNQQGGHQMDSRMMWVMMAGCCLAIPLALIIGGASLGGLAGVSSWLIGAAHHPPRLQRAPRRRPEPTIVSETATDPASAVARRYDRIARFYDAFEAPMDLLGGSRRRARTVGGATGRILEVGIGTGRNLDHYPPEAEVTGIDISPQMMARARQRAQRIGRSPRLDVADVEHLPYPDASFDTVIATCVFCSVPDPVAGLSEVARVTRPDGQIRLLEHVRPRNPLLGWLADQISPAVQRLVGPAINRRTEDNVSAAGLESVEVRRNGVWREIHARPLRQ